MSVSEHANYLLNEYGRLQFDYAVFQKPDGESLRNEARNNLEEYIAELEADNNRLKCSNGTQIDALVCGEIVKECNNVATPIDVALRKRIAKLEADNAEFRQLIRDWSIVLDQGDKFQLSHVESVRQAMLEINKEREK